MTPISLSDKLALLSAFFVAFTGPIPMILGSTPTTAELTILALGCKLYFLTASSDATMTAADPSLRPLALPAVTDPPSLNTALNFDKASIEVSCLINSS